MFCKNLFCGPTVLRSSETSKDNSFPYCSIYLTVVVLCQSSEENVLHTLFPRHRLNSWEETE